MTEDEIKQAQAFIDDSSTDLEPAVPTFPKGAEFTFRFAEPKDADSFSLWVAENPQVDRTDVATASIKENPSTTYLVIERDGEPVMFLSAFLVMRIGYLGFNPAADAETRKAAMELMLHKLQELAALFSISTIDVLTKSSYSVAEWARAHGFDPDPRELFSLKCGAQAD
jgi:hypothetical protein